MSTPIIRMNPPALPDAANAGYSQISVVEPGRLAFVSGQVAWTPEGGAVPDTLEEQAEIVFGNLGHALAALGAQTNDIVQMRIFVTDLDDEAMAFLFPAVRVFLAGAQPSLTGIGVAALASPELKLEIEMVVRAA